MEIKIDLSKVRIEDGAMILDLDNDTIQSVRDGGKVELGSLNVGDRFMIGDDRFIVLEHTDNGTKVISESFIYTSMKFGDSSDWKQSKIRSKLNDAYYKRLVKVVGSDSIIPMKRNLTSLDGLDDYGMCEDNVSMLTAGEYAKYHKTLGLKSNYPAWWWTITPASTPSNDYSRGVCCVCSRGVLCWGDCDCENGVRPFCILKSSLLVLVNKD